MNRIKLSTFCILVFTASFLGCAPEHDENVKNQSAGGGEDVTPVEQPKALDYETVRLAVLEPQCVSCHKAGERLLSLETYDDVFKVIRDVKKEVERGKMPPRSVLSDADKKLLLDWIALGAPETVSFDL